MKTIKKNLSLLLALVLSVYFCEFSVFASESIIDRTVDITMSPGDEMQENRLKDIDIEEDITDLTPEKPSNDMNIEGTITDVDCQHFVRQSISTFAFFWVISLKTQSRAVKPCQMKKEK